MSDWPHEHRDPPPEMAAEAAANPDGTVAEIDGDQISDPAGYVPPEAIVGVYLVGPDGRPTGEFVRNPGYGPVHDDFTRLEAPDHWLGWLPDTPSASVRGAVERLIDEQVPGSTVEWIKVDEDPVFVTGGRQAPDGSDRILVTRAGLAAPFALAVVPPQGEREILTGVLSWVAIGLDESSDRHDRVWLDLGMTREAAETLLHERIAAVHAPA